MTAETAAKKAPDSITPRPHAAPGGAGTANADRTAGGTGFAEIVGQIEDVVTAASCLRDAVQAIVSFNGRLTLELGTQSLTALQHAISKKFGDARVYQDPQTVVSGMNVAVGMRGYGRIILEPEPRLAAGDRVFGYFILGMDDWHELLNDAKRIEQQDARLDHEVRTFYADVRPQQVQEIIDVVSDHIDHIDPVVLYVDDLTFTNFGIYNNLLVARRSIDTPSFLHDIRQKPPSSWTWTEKRFVYAAYCVIIGGYRIEVYNGRQMTPAAVDVEFTALILEYRSVLADHVVSMPDTLPGKARALAELKERMRDDHIFYRWVSGITFYKQERYAAKASLPATGAKVPERISGYLRDTCGIDVGAYATADKLFATAVKRGLDGGYTPRQPGRYGVIEELIVEIVSAAVEDIKADIGMSRGLRDLGNLLGVNTDGFGRVACDWPTGDYFCAVVPSVGMTEKLAGTRETMFRILTAIAGRMQYNSWHYMPGHFEAKDIPEGRHYYFPPRMSDTAEWSNLHHPGHVLANVLYSIRSPGYVDCGTKRFHAMFDLRLMRQQGRPFSLDELMRANAYTGYLRCVYQALVDIAMEFNLKYRIGAFDKPWYRQHYAA